MLTIGLFFACAFFILFIVVIINLRKNEIKAQRELLNQVQEYPTVSAGDDKEGITNATSVSITYNQFKAKNGCVLNPYEYDQYIVVGNSMKYCGILNDDLVFVKKGFKLDDLTKFPSILVFSWKDAKPNHPKYKLRRAWKVCNIDDDLKKILEEITEPRNFKSIRDIECFDSVSVMKKDFFDRCIAEYKKREGESGCKDIVISTTFHVDNNKVRFSIHPVTAIMGIVEESFTVKKYPKISLS